MGIGIAVVFVGLAIARFVLGDTIVHLEDYQVLVIFRFGQTNQRLVFHGPGIQAIVPFIERAVWLDLRVQRATITTDVPTGNGTARTTLSVAWQIVDPLVTASHDGALRAAVLDATAKAVHEALPVRGVTPEADPRGLADAVRARVTPAVLGWGTVIRSLEVADVIVSPEPSG